MPRSYSPWPTAELTKRRDNLLSEKRRLTEYPAKIIAKRGPRELFATPKIHIGTVHSFKGGEADVVFLFPDLSPAAMAEWESGGKAKDNVVRAFYVAVTRARETLCLGQAATKWNVWN